MVGKLPFEQPLAELRAKIDELRKFGTDKNFDFTDEIARLEEKYEQLEKEVYGNLTVHQKIQIVKSPSRPTSLDYIGSVFTDFIELHGDRMFGDDLAIVGGLAKLNGLPVTVIGHQKGRDTKDNIARNFGMPHPEGYRKALRFMQQANKFKRPIITLIDVTGAYPGVTAEERGQAEAIARNLREMASFGVPIICVVTGEGGSGGALALGVGNRVLMLEHAVYSVLSPEGAAAIVYKDASKAPMLAEAMKITAQDLKGFGVIDDIVPEPKGGAHRNPEQQAEAVREALWRHLRELQEMTPDELREDRYKKFRAIGRFTTYTP
ncbi:acetyl-CoA carboxylase carboxyltransferase subunit alpha [Paenibacillus contaminans]|uniref:Acetyl-coenzyme A carboxylase carboxyl transferase subunit alpha n=1 Tax=Paenibacillus contaminans TaxID=450362 RepID=A0A329M147_9BACL|nr:acetyl-CoA carboxylase carboxyltransferase subunit alpha [Paenibacillus contaminans]RAV10607.1 acetyl-CoA carboxylase carboxyl transferase subunit alpha [Paenibacillus contaminans]